MTCDGFYVKNISFMDRGTWRMQFTEGDCKIQVEVYDEAVQEAVSDNFVYLMDTAAKEISDRVLNLWDEGKITDQQKQNFIDILRMVIE